MKELICIVCPNGCRLQAQQSEAGEVSVSGNLCPRGVDFARAELTCPTRSLTTTLRTDSERLPVLPVRTDGEIPKDRVRRAVAQLAGLRVKLPVRCGQLVLQNVADTGVDVIATCTME